MPSPVLSSSRLIEQKTQASDLTPQGVGPVLISIFDKGWLVLLELYMVWLSITDLGLQQELVRRKGLTMTVNPQKVSNYGMQ